MNRLFTSGRHYYLILLTAMAGMLYGCEGKSNEPDVSHVEVRMNTARFDLDLYALDTNRLGEGLTRLKAKYPDFLDYFLDTLMAYGIHGNYNDTVRGVREDLKQFLTFRDFVLLEDSIKAHFPDTKNTDKQLEDGFRRLKYYFTDFQVPKVLYLNLGLSKWPTFPLDRSTLCVALDMFLGGQYPYYRSVGIPDYMNSHLGKNYIPVSVFTAFYRGYYPFRPEDHTLLDLMIQRGKEQYFLHRILPEMPDSTLFGFKQRQLDWCEKNENLVYNFFIHQNLLYNKEPNNTMPYVTDGPFARGLEPPTGGEKITPGNIGTWMGYRIVSAYMEQHKELSLRQMLDSRIDAPRLLEEAKYKPR